MTNIQPTLAELTLRPPRITDGSAMADLIRSSPPLDANSTYAYLLLCRDFAATCAVAETRDGTIAGALTAYRPPERANVLFVWQVAVAPPWRGCGLGGRLLDHVVERQTPPAVDHIETTIGPGNGASQRLFAAFAERRACPVVVTPLFDATQLGMQHEPEHLHRIGPFITATFTVVSAKSQTQINHGASHA